MLRLPLTAKMRTAAAAGIKLVKLVLNVKKPWFRNLPPLQNC